MSIIQISPPLSAQLMTQIRFTVICKIIEKIYKENDISENDIKILMKKIRLERSFDYSTFTNINQFDLPKYKTEYKQDEKVDEEYQNLTYQTSERVVFKCVCGTTQTSNYNTFTKKHPDNKMRYCLNNNCKYFLERKNLGTYDVAKHFMEKNLLLLDKYTDCFQELRLKCLKPDCGIINKMKYKNFKTDGYTCNLCMFLVGELKGKKNWDFKAIFDHYKLECISDIPTQERDDVTLKCVNNHEFTYKVSVFKDRAKKKNFCDICNYYEWYYKYKNILQKSRVTDIKEHDLSQKIIISDIVFEFKCPDGIHDLSYTIGGIKSSIKLDGKFHCVKCNKIDKNENILDIIKKQCSDKGFKFEKYFINAKKVQFYCKCKKLNERSVSGLLNSNYNGCNGCAKSNYNVSYGHIYNGKTKKYELKHNKETMDLQSNEGKCFDYLFSKYKYERNDVVIAKELFYKHSESAREELNHISDERKSILNSLDIKQITYHDLDNKLHYYYPDGFLISKNSIIECKSSTIDCDRQIYGCLKLGYNVILLRYHNDMVYEYNIPHTHAESYRIVLEKSLINSDEIKIDNNRPEQTNVNARPVCQFSKNFQLDKSKGVILKFLAEHKSVGKASKDTNDKPHWIEKCADAGGITDNINTNNFYWMWKKDYDNQDNKSRNLLQTSLEGISKNGEEEKYIEEKYDNKDEIYIELEQEDYKEEKYEDESEDYIELDNNDYKEEKYQDHKEEKYKFRREDYIDGVEKWRQFKNNNYDISISSLGKIKNNLTGNLLKINNQGRARAGIHDVYLGRTMAIAFEIPNYEQLQDNKYTTHFNGKKIVLNLKVITQGEKNSNSCRLKESEKTDIDIDINKINPEYIHLLTVDKLKEICKGLDLPFNTKSKKQDLIKNIKDKLEEINN